MVTALGLREDSGKPISCVSTGWGPQGITWSSLSPVPSAPSTHRGTGAVSSSEDPALCPVSHPGCPGSRAFPQATLQVTSVTYGQLPGGVAWGWEPCWAQQCPVKPPHHAQSSVTQKTGPHNQKPRGNTELSRRPQVNRRQDPRTGAQRIPVSGPENRATGNSRATQEKQHLTGRAPTTQCERRISQTKEGESHVPGGSKKTVTERSRGRRQGPGQAGIPEEGPAPRGETLGRTMRELGPLQPTGQPRSGPARSDPESQGQSQVLPAKRQGQPEGQRPAKPGRAATAKRWGPRPEQKRPPDKAGAKYGAPGPQTLHPEKHWRTRESPGRRERTAQAGRAARPESQRAAAARRTPGGDAEEGHWCAA